MDKHLILLSALYKPEAIQALETQLMALFLQEVKNDILILTQADYKEDIESRVKHLGLSIQYFILEAKTPLEASAARLRVFEYPKINEYSRVLFLDSGVLLYNPIDPIFTMDLDSSKLYAIEDGWLSHPWWGGELFHPNAIQKDSAGFSTAILLFQVSEEIKTLFRDIISQIHQNKTKKQTDYLDQPYIIFQSVTQKKYDNTALKILNEQKNILLRVSRLPMVYNKTIKINEYMKRIYTRLINTAEIVPEERVTMSSAIQGKEFRLKELSSGTLGSIGFRDARVTVHLGPNSFWGSYHAMNGSTCQVNYGNQDYIVRFSRNQTFFVSIRKFDLGLNHGFLQ